MLWLRINQSDPERCFISVYNSYSTASLTNGQPVKWDMNDADGVSVSIPTAGHGLTFAGIVAETIAAGAYGLIQIYGYHSAVLVRTITGGSPAGATNIPLAMSAAAFCLETLTTATTTTGVVRFPCAFLMAAQASSTIKAVAAFIKAM